jgi:protein farnesyltransferase subunit beta
MTHENGESDLRAVYCALVICDILGILDEEITQGVCENIKRCQTFEGGLGPEPYSEAHGGYSFCGIGALIILDKLDCIDVEKFIRWLVNRQMTEEGGFQGRTNKLVDSCYSLWQAGVFNMLMNYDKEKYTFDSELLYDQLALQGYILFCCQSSHGGLFDKPGKYPDLFHTNYAMLGLALSQKTILENNITVSLCYDEEMNFSEIDPVFTISAERLKNAKEYYRKKLN